MCNACKDTGIVKGGPYLPDVSCGCMTRVVSVQKMYAVVIDTTAYAGNFNRQIVAYITGMTGDCGVGQEFVPNDIPNDIQLFFEEHVLYSNDHNGCDCIAKMRETPGWTNDGDGKFSIVTEDNPFVCPAYMSVEFNIDHDTPLPENVIEWIKSQAMTFCHEGQIDLTGINLFEVTTKVTEKKIKI